jgi:hypothetical protein
MVMISVTAVVVVNFGLSYSCPFVLQLSHFLLQFVWLCLTVCLTMCLTVCLSVVALLSLQLSLLSYSCRVLSYSRSGWFRDR